jgi:hypothetical protein
MYSSLGSVLQEKSRQPVSDFKSAAA